MGVSAGEAVELGAQLRLFAGRSSRVVDWKLAGAAMAPVRGACRAQPGRPAPGQSNKPGPRPCSERRRGRRRTTGPYGAIARLSALDASGAKGASCATARRASPALTPIAARQASANAVNAADAANGGGGWAASMRRQAQAVIVQQWPHVRLPAVELLNNSLGSCVGRAERILARSTSPYPRVSHRADAASRRVAASTSLPV